MGHDTKDAGFIQIVNKVIDVLTDVLSVLELRFDSVQRQYVNLVAVFREIGGDFLALLRIIIL